MKYGASVATAAVVDDAIVAAADAMFAHNVKPSFAIVAAFFRSLFVVQPLLLFCVSPVWPDWAIFKSSWQQIFLHK